VNPGPGRSGFAAPESLQEGFFRGGRGKGFRTGDGFECGARGGGRGVGKGGGRVGLSGGLEGKRDPEGARSEDDSGVGLGPRWVAIDQG
jgi:hypothetical protein